MDGLNIGISGFVDEVRKAGHSVVPTAWGMAQPAGPVTAHAFERMSAALVDGYRRSGADVIFVELHGAMVADGYDDAEGELLRRIRAVVGPDTPIVGTLDLHVNMSDAMVAHTDLLSAYRTYPHVDWAATGRRVARWLERVRAWGKPAKAMRRMPFLIPVTAGCSMISPAKELYETLEAIEAETGVHLSFTPGFPPADIADCGPAVFGYGADQATVDRAVDRLADAVNAAEPAFAAQRVQPVAEAVANAIRIAATAQKPVVLADTQDNPGAGAPSNTTGIIAELLAQGAQGALVGILHDPAVGGGRARGRHRRAPQHADRRRTFRRRPDAAPRPLDRRGAERRRVRGHLADAALEDRPDGQDRGAAAERRRGAGREHPPAADPSRDVLASRHRPARRARSSR